MKTPSLDLDEEIDRRAVPALKTHRIVLGADGAHLFPAGVADMDFKAPPSVLSAMRKWLHHVHLPRQGLQYRLLLLGLHDHP